MVCMHAQSLGGRQRPFPWHCGGCAVGVGGVFPLFLGGKEMFSYKICLLSRWLAWCLVKEE